MFGGRDGDGTRQVRAALVDDKTNTIATQLASRLREEIVSGSLRPGSKMNLAAAREQFDGAVLVTGSITVVGEARALLGL